MQGDRLAGRHLIVRSEDNHLHVAQQAQRRPEQGHIGGVHCIAGWAGCSYGPHETAHMVQSAKGGSNRGTRFDRQGAAAAMAARSTHAQVGKLHQKPGLPPPQTVT